MHWEIAFDLRTGLILFNVSPRGDIALQDPNIGIAVTGDYVETSGKMIDLTTLQINADGTYIASLKDAPAAPVNTDPNLAANQPEIS